MRPLRPIGRAFRVAALLGCGLASPSHALDLATDLAAMRAWTAEIRGAVAPHLPMSRALRAAARDRCAVLGFRIARDGTVVAPAILRGSGDTGWDRTALAGLVAASPLPPPPPGLVQDGPRRVTLPLAFAAGRRASPCRAESR